MVNAPSRNVAAAQRRDEPDRDAARGLVACVRGDERRPGTSQRLRASWRRSAARAADSLSSSLAEIQLATGSTSQRPPLDHHARLVRPRHHPRVAAGSAAARGVKAPTQAPTIVGQLQRLATLIARSRQELHDHPRCRWRARQLRSRSPYPGVSTSSSSPPPAVGSSSPSTRARSPPPLRAGRRWAAPPAITSAAALLGGGVQPDVYLDLSRARDAAEEPRRARTAAPARRARLRAAPWRRAARQRQDRRRQHERIAITGS